MSSSITPVLMPVSLATCWPARDWYSAVCWPGPATPATGPGEQLLTRTALLKAGYSRATIAAMTPVAERQNRHSGDWYPLYRVQTETRDDSGEKT